MRFIFKEANVEPPQRMIISKQGPISPNSTNARALQRIVDKLKPLIQASITRGLNTFRGRVDLRDLLEAIELGDLAAIEQSIPFELLEEDLSVLGELVGNGVEFSGEESTKFFKRSVSRIIPTLPVGEFQFNVNSAAVQAFINNRTAELVVGVNQKTKEAIREVVNFGLQQGVPPRTLARSLKDSVGLSPRDARAVLNFRRKLEEGFPLTELQSTFGKRFRRGQGVDDVVSAYADRLIRNRSLLIARTEAQIAVNEGQKQVWNQAADAGLFNRETAQNQWVVVPDGRLDCCICRPMQGQVVPFGEPFILPDGRSVTNPSESHPGCRCHVILVFGEDDGGMPLIAQSA